MASGAAQRPGIWSMLVGLVLGICMRLLLARRTPSGQVFSDTAPTRLTMRDIWSPVLVPGSSGERRDISAMMQPQAQRSTGDEYAGSPRITSGAVPASRRTRCRAAAARARRGRSRRSCVAAVGVAEEVVGLHVAVEEPSLYVRPSSSWYVHCCTPKGPRRSCAARHVRQFDGTNSNTKYSCWCSRTISRSLRGWRSLGGGEK